MQPLPTTHMVMVTGSQQVAPKRHVHLVLHWVYPPGPEGQCPSSGWWVGGR
jgi:hypothetical protein